MSSKERYAVQKTKELIEAGKIAVDIMIKTLKEDFERETETDEKGNLKGKPVDLMKLKTFIESKKLAFFQSKDLIVEIENLEKQLEIEGEADLETKEFTANFLEESAEQVK